MRKIKFRAWDNKKKIMIIQDNTDRIDKCLTYYELNKSVELMQYTGLKDKNGKEIYEGDILQFDAKEWGDNKTNLFQVKWCLESGEWDTGGGTNQECKDFKKIIGNIYENPELLESE